MYSSTICPVVYKHVQQYNLSRSVQTCTVVQYVPQCTNMYSSTICPAVYKHVQQYNLSRSVQTCTAVQFVPQCTNMYSSTICPAVYKYVQPILLFKFHAAPSAPCHLTPPALQHIAVCRSLPHSAHYK
jgi:hypothetical protein